MNKKTYTILIVIFAVIWVVGIIIGYKKGKVAQKKAKGYAEVKLSFRKKARLSIMEAEPILFSVDKTLLEPEEYQYKINIENKFSLIDEKGNKSADSFNPAVDEVFSFNILDSDIKAEKDLKKQIMFDNKDETEEAKTEYYKGFVDNEDTDEIKDSKYEVYTNL